ncbi:MAG: aminoacyl-tRNA hydrolase [Patescibacteria group bacterium]
MKLIVGLGNPGSKYARTRHNIGFMVIDELAKKLDLKFIANKSYIGDWAKNESVELIKPQTFMNNSGSSVSKIVQKHNLLPQDILIIMDDIDIELGKLRYRTEGSSGGHKGMQSIIDALGTNEFARLKIGIGRPPFGVEPDEYVTQKFTPEQLAKIIATIPEAIKVIKNQFLCL